MKSHHWLLVGAIACYLAGLATFVLSVDGVFGLPIGASLTLAFWQSFTLLISAWLDLR